jgi:hypothetical protein
MRIYLLLILFVLFLSSSNAGLGGTLVGGSMTGGCLGCNQWNRMTDYVASSHGTGVERAVAAAVGTDIYVGTGLEYVGRKDWWKYDTLTDIWTQKLDFNVNTSGAVAVSVGTDIYFGTGYKEPWYLLVPSGTSLTAEEIVDLYAKRMSIEQGFRDWKTHLGVRGLVFFGENPAPRLTRLLLAFSLSYLLCLALGSTEEAQAVRAFVEIKRHKPRHGTTRTLSVLSIGILRLSLPKFEKQAYKDLLKMIQRLSRGKGVIQWCLSPPKSLPPYPKDSSHSMRT